MLIDGIEYDVVVTSANDYDYLSLECCNGDELLIEAELISYTEQKAKIHFYKSPLSLELVDTFVQTVKHELKFGGNSGGF